MPIKQTDNSVTPVVKDDNVIVESISVLTITTIEEVVVPASKPIDSPVTNNVLKTRH